MNRKMKEARATALAALACLPGAAAIPFDRRLDKTSLPSAFIPVGQACPAEARWGQRTLWEQMGVAKRFKLLKLPTCVAKPLGRNA